jgi:hypothetical protein
LAIQVVGNKAQIKGIEEPPALGAGSIGHRHPAQAQRFG